MAIVKKTFSVEGVHTCPMNTEQIWKESDLPDVDWEATFFVQPAYLDSADKALCFEVKCPWIDTFSDCTWSDENWEKQPVPAVTPENQAAYDAHYYATCNSNKMLIVFDCICGARWIEYQFAQKIPAGRDFDIGMTVFQTSYALPSGPLGFLRPSLSGVTYLWLFLKLTDEDGKYILFGQIVRHANSLEKDCGWMTYMPEPQHLSEALETYWNGISAGGFYAKGHKLQIIRRENLLKGVSSPFVNPVSCGKIENYFDPNKDLWLSIASYQHAYSAAGNRYYADNLTCGWGEM
ncbi:MAG: hypothetical protein GY749_05475 [Desulfobacteraceae bacterium]|nr:hypothetical protein [Desulfobacteraceae bacterium]